MDSFKSRALTKWLVRIGVPLSVFLVILFLAVKFAGSIWLNSQRTQLERVLTDATGLTTRIKGTITATLFPAPGVSLGGITMEHDGNTVVAATSFNVNFDLLPLFDHKLIPHHVDIDQLWLQLPADARARPVLALKPANTSATLARDTFGLKIDLPDRIELHNSTIVVRSPTNDELHFVRGLNLAVHPVQNRLSLLPGHVDQPGDEWLLQLYLNFEQAKFDHLVMGPSRFSARFGPHSGKAELNDSNVFDGMANGTLAWQLANGVPEYQANLTLADFNAGKSVLMFRPSSFIQGRLNVSANLASKGSSLDQLLANASGDVKMEGKDLDLVSTNLDELVTQIIKSKQYNLVDAAAYFFIGPFAVSATKSLDYANVAREFSKPGTAPNKVKRIHTSWRLSNGIATAQDVAMQTQRYLLALKGGVNLVNKTFDNVTIGVVNSRGCAIATQKFYGSIASPSMEKTNILLSLTRPMLDALTKSAKGLVDSKCETPFYSGILVSEAKTPAPDSTQKPAAADSESKIPGDTDSKTPPSNTASEK